MSSHAPPPSFLSFLSFLPLVLFALAGCADAMLGDYSPPPMESDAADEQRTGGDAGPYGPSFGGAYVDPPGSPIEPTPMADCARVRVVTSGIDLNVRARPARDAEIVATLAEGTVVDVLGMVEGDIVEGENRWYEIATPMETGFITAYWVDCADDEEPPSTEPPSTEPPSTEPRTRGLVPFDGFRLPLRCGKTARISQGNNGGFSHTGRSRYAFDFAVARGTVLRAMAPGRVVNVDSGTRPGDHCYNGGGPECRSEANYVRIRHSDGSITAYWHLNRALVARGDRVASGDPIGRSGSSGYSTGPHTHVVRERNCDSIACQSRRLRFLDVRGDGVPHTGDTVRSGNCPNRGM